MNGQKHIITRRGFVGTAIAFGALSYADPVLAWADPTLEGVQSEVNAAREKLSSLQNQMDIASNDYNQALEEQDLAQKNMDEAQRKIETQTQLITNLQGQLSTRARSMYRTGSNTFLDVLLGSATWEEFATNWDMLSTMNAEDAALVDTTRESRLSLEESKAFYVDQRNVAAEKAYEAKTIAAQAQETVAQQQQIYNGLSAQAAELLEQQRREEEAAAAASVPSNLAAVIAAGGQGEAAGSGTATSGDNAGGSSGSAADTGQDGDAGGGYVEPTPAPAPAPTPEPTPEPEPDPAPSYDNSVAATVIAAAQSRLGCPYVWGAKGPDSFDCSGLVAWCYAQAGVYAPSYTGSLIGLPRSDGQPGDICVRHDDYSQHTGIYVGGGSMIHAPTTGDVVRYGSVQSGMVFVRPSY